MSGGQPQSTVSASAQSRYAPVRRQLRFLRYGLGAAAALAFALLGFVVRAAHPGGTHTHTSASAALQAPPAFAAAERQALDITGGAAIAAPTPATSPTVQTSAS
jgi:hypothetical protein